MDHTGSARGKSSAVLVRIQHIRMAADYRVLLAAERAGAIRMAIVAGLVPAKISPIYLKILN
jgi:hypothetical protein